jgi:hypothetical protein
VRVSGTIRKAEQEAVRRAKGDVLRFGSAGTGGSAGEELGSIALKALLKTDKIERNGKGKGKGDRCIVDIVDDDGSEDEDEGNDEDEE